MVQFALNRVLGENLSMPQETDTDSNNALRRLIETIDIATMVSAPITRALTSLLETSAAELGASEASVLIRANDEGDLKFLSATGSVADQLFQMNVPAGKGIAGFVFSSGQPLVVSDVEETESFYAEIDKSTGYSTQMVLATPLSEEGEIVGVLEYINRNGVPPYKPFTPEEMDKAAFYATAISSLVKAYESAKLFCELSDKVLKTGDETESSELRSWLANLRDASDYRDMLELAVLLREVANKGEAERALTKDILESILRFSEAKDQTLYLG